jgi:uncharacterized membrane protein YoaK (UPF0700 family)
MTFSTKNSLTTLFQTFIMGAIDAYTFQNFAGSFVSAQTGNLVVFAYELVSKGWQTAYVRLPVLIGFLIGAFISQAAKHLPFSDRNRFIIPLAFSTLLLAIVDGTILLGAGELTILFILGFFSGYELTVFNKIGGTSVNNGIMTGNLKNFSNNVYEAIFSRNHQALLQAGFFLSGIMMFVLGIIFSAYWLHAVGPNVLLVAMVINIFLIVMMVGFKNKPQTD